MLASHTSSSPQDAARRGPTFDLSKLLETGPTATTERDRERLMPPLAAVGEQACPRRDSASGLAGACPPIAAQSLGATLSHQAPDKVPRGVVVEVQLRRLPNGSVRDKPFARASPVSVSRVCRCSDRRVEQ